MATRRAAEIDEDVGQPAVGADHQRFVADVELAAACHVLIDLELLAFRRLAVVDEAALQVAPLRRSAADGRRGKSDRQRAGGGGSGEESAASNEALSSDDFVGHARSLCGSF